MIAVQAHSPKHHTHHDSTNSIILLHAMDHPYHPVFAAVFVADFQSQTVLDFFHGIDVFDGQGVFLAPAKRLLGHDAQEAADPFSLQLLRRGLVVVG